MSNETVRIGVVGAGDATRSGHIPKFRAIEGVEVVGVVNRSRQSSQRVADELGIPTVYENWRDLVADPDIDAVFIGTWPHMHRPVVLGALEHDKHVLTEARFARKRAGGARHGRGSPWEAPPCRSGRTVGPAGP